MASNLSKVFQLVYQMEIPGICMEMIWNSIHSFNSWSKHLEPDPWHYGERGLQCRLVCFGDVYIQQVVTFAHLALDDYSLQKSRGVGSTIGGDELPGS